MSRGRRSGRSDRPERLGSVIDGLQGTRPWASGMALGRLGRRWRSVVGERLAEECRPLALEGGILLVLASSGAWAAQVRFLAEGIRAGANQVLGQELVRDVKVVQGEL